jgi:hypothetical protein
MRPDQGVCSRKKQGPVRTYSQVGNHGQWALSGEEAAMKQSLGEQKITVMRFQDTSPNLKEDSIISISFHEQSSIAARLDLSITRTERVYRHAPPVRLARWLNVICLFMLIMNGLQTFNAHSTLY